MEEEKCLKAGQTKNTYYKRINLKGRHFIATTRTDRAIINAIKHILSKTKTKVTLTHLYLEVPKLIGLKDGAGIRMHIKYCLMILFIKSRIRLNNFKDNSHGSWQFWTTWIWDIRNHRNVKFITKAKKKVKYENFEL